MLKRFRISTKIFSGFGLLIALLLVIAGAGVTGLFIANADFSEYRQLARSTNLTGQLQANMLLTRINVKDFVIDKDDESIAGVKQRAETTLSLIPDALDLAPTEEARTAIAGIEAQIQAYASHFDDVVAEQRKRDVLVTETLDVLGPRMEENLTAVMRSA